MKRERVDELALSGRSEFGYSNEGKAAVNNKGIPKGESSQMERGDEREGGVGRPMGPSSLSTQNIFIELASGLACVHRGTLKVQELDLEVEICFHIHV